MIPYYSYLISEPLVKRESEAAGSANDHVKDEKHYKLSKLTADLIMGDSVSGQSSVTAIAQALNLQCLVVLKTPTEEREAVASVVGHEKSGELRELPEMTPRPTVNKAMPAQPSVRTLKRALQARRPRSPFMRLPVELRLWIYAYLIPNHDEDEVVCRKKSNLYCTALFHVNTFIMCEASDVLYRILGAAIRIYYNGVSFGVEGSHSFEKTRVKPLVYAPLMANVRKLQIDLNIGDGRERHGEPDELDSVRYVVHGLKKAKKLSTVTIRLRLLKEWDVSSWYMQSYLKKLLEPFTKLRIKEAEITASSLIRRALDGDDWQDRSPSRFSYVQKLSLVDLAAASRIAYYLIYLIPTKL
ncbi:hypothetical protein H2199_005663 [Coniosporium tulheliwenetii]|uniref:Uncharacterized protein n=1 Tax=Coniosporium tulheliwenetii TaxID=3383036 RepID=A0ACC2Z0D5_9PEZI|nr:hypothetical protein H2199_005663 [Cladosporium sp. JES 115]